MTLVYGIKNPDDICKGHPGVSGSFYLLRRGRELPAERRRHSGADADRCWAPCGRECGLPALWTEAFQDPVLGTVAK